MLKDAQDICLQVIEENIEIDTKKIDYTAIKNNVREKLGKFLYKETESRPMIITVIQEV